MSRSAVGRPGIMGVALLLALVWGSQPLVAAPQTDTLATDAQPVDDLWDFDDDEDDVETWGTLLRDQASDLAFIIGFATLTLVGFFPEECAPQVCGRWRPPSSTWGSARAS